MCVVSGWAAVVTFGVPERCVDALIEFLHGSSDEPGRWLVFGHDMDLLGAIHEHWNGAIDITIALLPATDAMIIDVVVDILTMETVHLARCAWIHGRNLAGEAPRELGLVIAAGAKDDAATLAAALRTAIPASALRQMGDGAP
jgi:hypothetical protein